MQAVAGIAVLVAALATVAPAHAGSTCPADKVEGQSLLGSWEGYVLSQVPNGYYTTANMAMVITENSSNQMYATLNLTAPTCSGKGCPSTKPPSGCAFAARPLPLARGPPPPGTYWMRPLRGRATCRSRGGAAAARS